MEKLVQSGFKDEFSYSASAEKWVHGYFEEIQFSPKFTFVSDLCIEDWYNDESKVRETYKRIINEWGSDYKAFTELVMEINMLSWFNNQLIKQGFDGRQKWVDFYSNLYYEARDTFYKRYDGNDEAQEYFFNCTD